LRILLTGADGFTGRIFAQQATAGGHDVKPLRADLTDPEALTKEVMAIDPDAVLHLAAISFVGHADEDAFYAVNVVGTTNLLTALSKLKKCPYRVVVASSANVYGNSKASPVAESETLAPISHYAASKLAMEHMARTFHDKLPIVITRPFNYTGPGQAESFVVPKLIKHFASRAPSISLGNIQVEREFNDVQMVCGVYLKLLQYGEAGETYNICSGRPYTLQHVLNALESITGHHIQIELNPDLVRANEVYSLYGSAVKLQALLNRHGHELSFTVLDDTLKRMLTALGREFTTVL
jgi:GDP-6-deoxy-D-talose 4-dehydrogenase